MGSKTWDFLIGIITGLISSFLYATYFSGLDQQSLLIWLANHWRETTFFALFIIVLIMLLRLNNRRNIKKITLYCPSCQYPIRDYELFPGERLIGCNCRETYKIIVNKDLSYNVEFYTRDRIGT
jgi:hypothetical protein